MARPITTTSAAKLSEHCDKINSLLALMYKADPDDAQELLRLSALISYELTHITSIQPTKKQ